MTESRRVDELADIDRAPDPAPWLRMLRGMWAENPRKQERYRQYFVGLPLDPGVTVLEVGCGAGGASRFLAQTFPQLGLVVGTDSSWLAVQEAVAANLAVTSNAAAPVRFAVADGRHLPFPDGAFAAAFCSRVLVHAHEPGRIVAEMARVVRPGGYLLAVEPDRDAMLCSVDCDHVYRIFWSERRSVNPQIGRRLYRLLAEAGLTIERVDPSFNVHRQPPSPEQVAEVERNLESARGEWWALVEAGHVSSDDLRAYARSLRQAYESGIYLHCDVEFAYLARKP